MHELESTEEDEEQMARLEHQQRRREMRRMRRGIDAGTNSLNPGLPSHDYPPLPLEDDEEPARLQQPSSPNSIIDQLFRVPNDAFEPTRIGC
jgi:hypothetical protein